MLTIGLTTTMTGADAESTDPADDELVFPGLPEAKLALIEVDDYTALSNLETFHNIDLAHWNDQTDEGRVRSAAFVTDAEIELLEELGVHIEDVSDLPTPDEAEQEYVGAIDEMDIADLISRSEADQRELSLKQQALSSATSFSSAASAEAGAEADQVAPPVDATDNLRVLRAEGFTNYSGNFLSVEVRSLFSTVTNANQRPDRVEISYAEAGDTTTRNLTLFVDASQYIYHRVARPVFVVGDLPSTLTVRLFERLRDEGGAFTGAEALLEELTVPVAPWAPYGDIGYPEGFQYGFVPGYLDSVDSTNAITLLAEQYPDLAELVKLPNQTNGYQRKAMLPYVAPTGTPNVSVVNVESIAWGHEGGNSHSFQILNTGVADQALSVAHSTTGTGNNQRQIITVTPATDGDGVVTSTAGEVVTAINEADEAVTSRVRAFTHQNTGGSGVVPTVGLLALSDYLNAPTHKIARGPRDVYMLRIGKHRDGSKTGVFAYSQEHAREWVTPVVAVETANRLLRNYGRDPLTTELVDNLDIFIVPTVNRDGTDYSRYDNSSQRRTMTNHCGDNASHAGQRNGWGVDLNRNFAQYSLFDGYSGASTSCTSDTFAGPAELSEPEARNSVWVVDQNPNIRFAMNTHTHGGYFMWAPGTYANPGRIPAPRPDLGVENFFFSASETILGRIAEHRGTVIEPGRTGPIIDVLYSAAGNSADHFWYDGLEAGRPVFGWSFEAGANIWNGTNWASPGTFYPTFMDEGWHQSMEFANGIYGMLEVALEFEYDDQAPTTTPNVRDDVNYSGPADVLFESDEPATIHYTVDGTEPTLESPSVQRWGHDDDTRSLTGGARDGAEPIHVFETTTLRWFGVDVAGNEEDARSLTVYINEEPPVVEPSPVTPPPAGIACAGIDGDSFDDVPSGAAHAGTIGCASGFKIVEGYGNGNFGPGANIQRGQMASMVSRMLEVAGVDLPANPADAFTDDNGTHHELAINQLASLGLVQGKGGGIYDPGGHVTREQTASYMVRAIEYILDRDDLTAPPSSFTDIATSAHRDNIEIAAYLNITEGVTATTFVPGANVRRDQTASFVSRTLDVLEDQGVTLTPRP